MTDEIRNVLIGVYLNGRQIVRTTDMMWMNLKKP